MEILFVLCAGFISGWVMCNLYWHLVVMQIIGRQRIDIENTKLKKEVIPGVNQGLFTQETEQKIKETYDLGVNINKSIKKEK